MSASKATAPTWNNTAPSKKTKVFVITTKALVSKIDKGKLENADITAAMAPPMLEHAGLTLVGQSIAMRRTDYITFLEDVDGVPAEVKADAAKVLAAFKKWQGEPVGATRARAARTGAGGAGARGRAL